MTDIDLFARAFIARTMPKADWTHAAHFGVALWLLRAKRASEMPQLIRAYNAAVGTPNTASGGYHETITLASLAAAQAALEVHPGAPLGAVLAALLAGPCGDKAWLLAHWSHDRLFGVQARATWIAPDLAPLPFAACGAGGATA